jgi:hypothetical protein
LQGLASGGTIIAPTPDHQQDAFEQEGLPVLADSVRLSDCSLAKSRGRVIDLRMPTTLVTAI